MTDQTSCEYVMESRRCVLDAGHSGAHVPESAMTSACRQIAGLEAEVERLRETLREVRDRWAFPKLVEIVDGALEEESR